MKPLYSFIKPLGYDCHVHLFNIHDKITPYESCGVGFPDISVRTEPELYTRDAVIDMYSRNIDEFPGYTVLATAAEPYTAIEVLEKFNLKGFGELKCYPKTRDGKDLPYKHIDYWWPLFEYANKYKLPVWIHWSLLYYDDVINFQQMLEEFPNTKFVLCHCGIDGEVVSSEAHTTQEKSFLYCCDLLKRHANMFADVSWTAAEFLLNNPQYHLPDGKYVIGTDLTPYGIKKNGKSYDDECLKNYLKIKAIYANTNILNIL